MGLTFPSWSTRRSFACKGSGSTPTSSSRHVLFESRHIGPDPVERDAMLEIIGRPSLDALVDATIPSTIRLPRPLNLPDGLSEHQYLSELGRLASRNRVFKSYIGLGYYDCVTPSVIVRNVLENPVRRIRVSGRNRSGTPRGPAPFPDDGQRADGNGHRERVAAR